MAKRFWNTPARIIVSKAGFDAGPSLADTHKIFDSDWNFSGLIIAAGVVTDSSDGHDPSPLVINFDSPGYVPAAVVLHQGGERPDGPAFTYADFVTTALNAEVFEDRIEVMRFPGNEGYWSRFDGTISYVVYAIGQA